MNFVAVFLVLVFHINYIPSVTACPTECECVYRTVSCTRGQRGALQHIPRPPAIPENTRRLDIFYHHNITSIRREEFHNIRSLESLGVCLSNVRTIEDGAFESLANLTSLNLGGNAIRRVCEATLRGLDKLEVLTLSHNGDMIMEPCSLSRLMNLNNLSLTNVDVHLDLWQDCADQSISTAVHTLRYLDVGGEGVHIDGELLIRLTGVESLHIANPQTNLLLGYDLSSLESLSELFLTGLTFFPREFLMGNDNLSRIDIRDSSFTHLPAYAFANKSLLNRITIISELTYIHGDALRGLYALRYLELNNNQLQTLPAGLFSDIQLPLEYLYLYGNRWNCNCSLHWLFDIGKKQNRHSGRCESPPALARVPLSEMDRNSLEPCETTSQHPTSNTEDTLGTTILRATFAYSNLLFMTVYYLALAPDAALLVLVAVGCLLFWARSYRNQESGLSGPAANGEADGGLPLQMSGPPGSPRKITVFAITGLNITRDGSRQGQVEKQTTPRENETPFPLQEV